MCQYHTCRHLLPRWSLLLLLVFTAGSECLSLPPPLSTTPSGATKASQKKRLLVSTWWFSVFCAWCWMLLNSRLHLSSYNSALSLQTRPHQFLQNAHFLPVEELDLISGWRAVAAKGLCRDLACEPSAIHQLFNTLLQHRAMQRLRKSSVAGFQYNHSCRHGNLRFTYFSTLMKHFIHWSKNRKAIPSL